MKSMYHYIREAWKNRFDSEDFKKRMIEWRKDPVIKVIERPTRLDRARNLGYKAKKGYIIARVRLSRGGRTRPRRKKGRRSKRMTIRKTLQMSYRWISEIRAENRFRNLVVLNSYWVGEDGKNIWFEVILADPRLNDIKDVKGRAVRGLTSAARNSIRQE